MYIHIYVHVCTWAVIDTQACARACTCTHACTCTNTTPCLSPGKEHRQSSAGSCCALGRTGAAQSPKQSALHASSETISTCICTYMYTHVYTHIYKHTNTQTLLNKLKCFSYWLMLGTLKRSNSVPKALKLLHTATNEAHTYNSITADHTCAPLAGLYMYCLC